MRRNVYFVLATALLLLSSVVIGAGDDEEDDAKAEAKAAREALKRAIRMRLAPKSATRYYCETFINENPGQLTMSTCGVVALAGGSFLTLRDALRPIPGVISVVIGYTGGWKKSVTYEEVCRDRTGHSEAVLVFFNKNQLPFARLLEVYFNSHDANGKEKQGDLVGLQFRSVVYLADHDQLEVFSSVKSSMDQKTVEKFEKEPDGLSPRLILTDTATLKPSAFQVEGLPDATLIQIRDKAQAEITKKVKTLTKEEIATLAQKVQIEAQNLKQAREVVDVSWIAKPNRNSNPQVDGGAQKGGNRGSTLNLNQDIPLPPKPPAKEATISEN